jgi:hypothetical protein
LKKSEKVPTKKLLAKGVQIMYPTFSPFSTVYKSSQPSNFLCVNFLLLFATNSAFFDIHIENIRKKYFWGHFSTCCKLLSQTRTKQLKKTKMSLRIQFFIHSWVRKFNFLKKNQRYGSASLYSWCG